MTCRELFTMASGRRQAMRLHAFQQAALVWMAKDIDIAEYVQRGDIGSKPKKSIPAELQAKVDEYIEQAMTTGRIVI